MDESVVQLVQQHANDSYSELEARIGRWDERGGVSVTEDELLKLDNLLRSSEHFTSTLWDERHCYFYTHNGRTLRTQVDFVSTDMVMRSTTVCKERRSIVDAVISNGMQCRVSLSSERPVQDVPELVMPNHVRIVQRASHTLAGRTCTVRYDLSRTWPGSSKSDAETQQQTTPARCELELELVACHTDAASVARSFVAKIEDLVQKLTDTA